MPIPPRVCYYNTTLVLAAATPRTLDVPINNATNWNIVVANTGANPLTALSVSSSPNGTRFGATVAITAVPVAAGASLPTIDGSSEPITTFRMTFTSTLGTTLSIEAGGS